MLRIGVLSALRKAAEGPPLPPLFKRHTEQDERERTEQGAKEQTEFA
jgi:hypothetical protein